jgi:hypothetical protein
MSPKLEQLIKIARAEVIVLSPLNFVQLRLSSWKRYYALYKSLVLYGTSDSFVAQFRFISDVSTVSSEKKVIIVTIIRETGVIKPRCYMC